MSKRERLTISVSRDSVAAKLLEEVRRELGEDNMSAALRTLVTTTAPLFIAHLRGLKQGVPHQPFAAKDNQVHQLSTNASHLQPMPARGADNASQCQPEGDDTSQIHQSDDTKSEAGIAFTNLLDF